MFQKSSIILKKLSNNKLFNFSTLGGNLYTWGSYSSGTGFNIHNEDPLVNTPKRVESFKGNVEKVVMGPYHSAVITTEGQLYTMGAGDFGALGNGSSESIEPQLVDFFAQKGLKVTDAVLGKQLSVVVTDNGQVWTFGFGGTYGYSALDWLNPRAGGLGNGSTNHVTEPVLVEGVQSPSQISVGDDFVIAVNQDGQVINWGNGVDGALADGICEGLLTPQVNENFELLREQEGLTIKTIKSASHFSVALMSDGNLYAWGRNNQGSMGIRSNLGHRTDGVATLPTKVVNQFYKDQKVIDYAVGENTLVILTDQNQVYWSGLDLAFKPIRWEIPSQYKITQVVASQNTFGALTSEGQLLSFTGFVANARWTPGSEYSITNVSAFGNESITQIGGSYGIRYAITQ